MKTHSLILAAATLLISGGIASAQMQYDSLGSPTPAPNQGASPTATAPIVPNTGGVSSRAKGDGAQSTTGSGAASGGVNDLSITAPLRQPILCAAMSLQAV